MEKNEANEIILEDTVSEESDMETQEVVVQEQIQIVQLENYETLEGLLVLILAIVFASWLTRERNGY